MGVECNVDFEKMATETVAVAEAKGEQKKDTVVLSGVKEA